MDKPAFPCTYDKRMYSGDMESFNDMGMSLRDYFAAKAMQALITKLPLLDKEGQYSEKAQTDEIDAVRKGVAESAYNYANEMLKERDK